MDGDEVHPTFRIPNKKLVMVVPPIAGWFLKEHPHLEIRMITRGTPMTYGNSPGSEDALFASGDDIWVQPLDFLE